MWLNETLTECSLSDAQREYLLARGAKEERIHTLQVTGWNPDLCPPQGDTEWLKFGSLGKAEQMRGRLVFPHLSGQGRLLGVDFRSCQGSKRISRYNLPEAAWVPSFVGLNPSVMDRIWKGVEIWLVEGVFDLFALDWVVPSTSIILGCGRAGLNQLQFAFLDRFCDRTHPIYVCFDEDPPGRKGVEGFTHQETGQFFQGVRDRLRFKGFQVVDVRYRGGKDPGEIWDRSGREGLERAFRSYSLGLSGKEDYGKTTQSDH